jgi:SecD/SecF fusion protein
MPRAAFSQIVNRSMSEVLTRSLATSFCTLLPVLALLLFGGQTLKDFAFALLVGIASGAYSSVFIAGPVLTHWKEREPSWRKRREGVIRRHGGVLPAYAVASRGGEPVDVEPEQRRRRFGRRGPVTPDQPAEVSREEFEELVRDIQEEPAPAPAPAEPEPEPEPEPPRPARTKASRATSTRSTRARSGAGDGRPNGEPTRAAKDEPETGDGEVTPAPDATAEEVEAAAPKPTRPKSARKSRGRSGRRR